MNPDLENDISIKYPESEKVIINKEIRIMEFVNKKVQISYNLN